MINHSENIPCPLLIYECFQMLAISLPVNTFTRLWTESRKEGETQIPAFCFPCISSPKVSVEIDTENNGGNRLLLYIDFNFVTRE